MTEFLTHLMMSDLFIPHGHCYLWNTELVGLHLVSDLTIAIAYFSIPLTLFYFVQKREDLPFNWIFTLFGAFIIFCGTTHILEVWTLWHPVYWLSGTVKALTAIVSAYTAIVLVRLVPQALKLPSPAQLEAANRELQQQIRDREVAEAQIQHLNEQLEARVAQRTQELEASMFQVRELAERMTMTIDAARMGTCDWNILTGEIIWNEYHALLLDYQSGAAAYSFEDWARRVHPDDLARVMAAIDLAQTSHTDYSSEYRVIWQDGSVHWLLGFGRFYYDSDGQPIRMAGIASDITPRKQSELALAESEERLQLAIDGARMGTYDWNLVTHQITWNEHHVALLGYLPEGTQYSYADWERRVHPEDLQRVKAAVQLAQDTQNDYACEYRIIWEDGSIHWIEAFGRFYYDNDGRAVRMNGVINNITDRKQAELKLRQNEEFTRRILESNKDCIKVLDLEGRLLYMNDSGKELMEIDDFAKLERSMWVQLWSDTESASAKQALATANAGKISKFEGVRPTLKGTLKYWEVTVSPLLDARGNVEQIMVISHDITERIHSESAIRESEERFRATFEQAAVGIAHVDLDGRWLLVNQKLCDIVGYSEAELLSHTFQDITHHDDLSPDLEYVRRLLAGEIQTYTLEKRYIHKLGKITWVNLTVSLRRDAAEQPLYFISVIEDINARKQSEFDLSAQAVKLAHATALAERRNQELDRFAYVVSHDLKAPLRGIANLAEWIEDDLSGQVDADTQTNLELMRSRVYRMETMINGLLEYARLGNTHTSLETFAVEDLLAEVVDSLNLPDTHKIELPSNLPKITTNRLLLDRVLANLIGNASKHHDRPDGRIQVTAQSHDESWEFTVTDDGPGIAPENRERVFGIFQTLARDDKNNTGIGLSIVKRLIEDRGGEIRIESPPDRGTTFRFTWVTVGIDERGLNAV